MKSFLLLISVLLLSLKSFEQHHQPEERFGVPGPLVFDNTNFKLVWTGRTGDSYYTQKYLPAGDSLNQFNQLLSLHLFKRDSVLEKIVQEKTQELDERKAIDKYCNYHVIRSNNGDEFMLDFLTSENKSKQEKMLEFNIWHYKLIEVEGKGKFIEVYVYTKRRYDDEIKPFLKQFGTYRIDALSKMVTAGMPAITKGL